MKPGKYFVSLRFADKPQKVDQPFGEMLRKNAGDSYKVRWKMKQDMKSRRRLVRLRTMIELRAGEKRIMPFHLISTNLSLKDALQHYPKKETFKVTELPAIKTLKTHGLKDHQIPLVLSALRRGGITCIPRGKSGPLLVQVQEEGTILVTSSKSSSKVEETKEKTTANE